MIFDKFNAFRQSQIENEGNDPAKSGKSQGTPADLAMGRTGRELEFDARDLDKDLKPEEEGGRPEEGPKYGKDGSARGRDPLASHDRRKQYGIALAHYDAMKKDLKKLKKSDRKLLEETMDVEKEYSKDVNSLNDDSK